MEKTTQKKKKYIEIDENEYDQILEDLVKNIMIQRQLATIPEFKSLLIYKTLIIPINLYKYIKWNILWCYKYNYKKLSYTKLDCEYLTKMYVKLTDQQWDVYITDNNK